MLKYLIIQLDDSATSFCNYESRIDMPKLISLEDLNRALVWAMKENLMVQFVYPECKLPDEYYNLIDSVDHTDIKPRDLNADVTVCNGIKDISSKIEKSEQPIILRLTKEEFFANIEVVRRLLAVNIVVSNIDSLTSEEQQQYSDLMRELSFATAQKIKDGKPVYINLLTDRIQLSAMNNCNAGVESITIAPDGNFYICPAFYFGGENNVGNPKDGLSIPNAQLYKLEYAPTCRNCDAYQCKRCVWLNKKKTLEVNTPSYEQCVASHIERNASRELLESLKEFGLVKTDLTISKIDYLDPFEKLIK